MMLPAIRMNPATAEHAGAEVVTADGRSLPLVSAALRADAQAGLARLVLEQRFENRYDETLHVTYRMPLPADGAVSGYAFEIGERVIVGRVDKKAAARETFERAVASGHTAALLEQERADIFTQKIGNLPAGEALVARITIDQRLAWLPEGEWELRFPTVIGPRYVGAGDTIEDARATKIGVATGGIAARIRIEVDIKDIIVRPASSPTHKLARREDGVIELREAARLDRDIVVRWPVARAEVGASLATARPSIGDSAYGLVTIVPPARDARHPVVPRDLIVLLDTSGSMEGAPLDKAKQVVAMLIETLGEADRLELIEFSNSPRRYKREPVSATVREKQEAIRWVRSRVAGGGTEMARGVTEALSTLRIGAQRQVVVVTDGYVGGEERIVRLLGEHLPKSCRLHVLGVGSAVNRSLSTALARAGRGAEVVVGPDEDAERAAKRLVDRTKRPMLTNVTVDGAMVIGHAPAFVPDVFEGAPVVVAVALQPHGGEIVVRGELATGEWSQRLMVAPIDAGTGNQAIFALYGREQVADLESRWTESFDREIEAIGLAFQISTRLTSWIAVDESRKVALAKRKVDVPQELPYGTTAESFGLRRAMARPTNQMVSVNAYAARFDVGEASMQPPGEAVTSDYLLGGAEFDDVGEEFAGELDTAHSTKIAAVRSQSIDDLEDFEGEEETGRALHPSYYPSDEMGPGGPPSLSAPSRMLETPPQPASPAQPRPQGEAGAPREGAAGPPRKSFVLKREVEDQKELPGSEDEGPSEITPAPRSAEYQAPPEERPIGGRPPQPRAPSPELKVPVRARKRASTVPGIIDPSANTPARPSMQAQGSPAQPAGGAPSDAPQQPGAPSLGSYSYQAYPQQPHAEIQEQAITTGKLPQRKPSRHWLAFWLILMLAALIAALVWWMA